MRVFTVADNASDARLHALLASARRGGVAVDVVLVEPHEQIGPGAFGTKLRKLASYVAPLASEELVVYVDGYDVLMDCTSAELEYALARAFSSYGLDATRDLLFSAETNCWPSPALAAKYPRSAKPSPFCFLCAGAFAGAAGAFRDMLRQHPFAESTDDQLWWTHRFLEQNAVPTSCPRIALDTQCYVFHNLFGAESRFRFCHGHWRNDTTATRALVLHGNGASKAFLFDTVGPKIGLGTTRMSDTAS